jgi:uncharacterized protein (DUF1697 family)
MNETRYVALLRGINVGGNNLIKMSDLRDSFANMELTNVATYIQSGNVVFSAKQKSKAKLAELIEKALSEAFSYESRVVLISETEIEQVLSQAPKRFGQEVEYRYDVLFVRDPLKATELLEALPMAPGVDTAQAGDHAVYFRRLIARADESKLTKLGQRAVFKNITVRNWNTTIKLAAMLRKA